MAEGISLEELALAARNHAMPYEALRYDVTPVGLHYLLIHYDIPEVDPTAWRLSVGGHVESPLELTLAADAQAPDGPVHVRHVVVDQQVVQADRSDRPAQGLERHPVIPRREVQLLEADALHERETTPRAHRS